jgi:hypothetical protein
MSIYTDQEQLNIREFSGQILRIARLMGLGSFEVATALLAVLTEEAISNAETLEEAQEAAKAAGDALQAMVKESFQKVKDFLLLSPMKKVN